MDSGKAMEKGIRQDSQRRRKGGIRTLPFIIANEALDKVPSVALLPTLTLFLKDDYHMNIASVHNLINYWQAVGNFAPVVAAFLADSYLGRFHTIGFGSIFRFLGAGIPWLTTILPYARPPSCDESAQNCKSATTGQMSILLLTLLFKSLGTGGIRPNSMPFGADQLRNKSEKVLETYFSSYFIFVNLGGCIALTLVFYILQQYGLSTGYGVSTLLMLLATVTFYLASPIYVKRKPNTSLFIGFVQVLVVAYKNRKLPLPSVESEPSDYHQGNRKLPLPSVESEPSDYHQGNRKLPFPSPQSESSDYHQGKGEITVPSEKLEFLNKACLIRDVYQDIGCDGMAVDPWRLCTVQKVEELKALFKVMPIWSTTLVTSIAGTQHWFGVLQANTLNRKIMGSFSIPANCMTILVYASIVIWLVIYEHVLIPLASKMRGKQVYIGIRVRMGMGLFISVAAMSTTAIVEGYRRKRAIEQGLLHDPISKVNMSVLWLFPQFVLLGLSEAFITLGQLEFYHREFPKTMKSIGNSFFFLSLAFANLLSDALFNLIDKATSRGGGTSWVADNLNEARFDKYFWILALLSFFNMFFYILCSRGYGYGAEVVDERYDSDEE